MTESELYKVLGEQGFGSADIIDFDDEGCDILIEWGDWKHDHLFSNHIATEVLNGCGVEILNSTEQETESDGSDWYTAIHTFYIMAQR